MVFAPSLRRAAAAQVRGTYQSPYAPKYYTPANFQGLNAQLLGRYGSILGSFGVATGVFLIFFFGEIPRVRSDILQKVPVIGSYWKREIPPEDNPF